VSRGRSFCSAASTTCRSSSKKAGSFIVGWSAKGRGSRFVTFRLKRLGGDFAVSFLQKNFDFAFGFFKLFLAFTRERDALLKEPHGVIQRKLRALELADDFLEACKRLFKFRFLCRFRFSRYWIVHSSRPFQSQSQFYRAFISDKFRKNMSTVRLERSV